LSRDLAVFGNVLILLYHQRQQNCEVRIRDDINTKILAARRPRRRANLTSRMNRSSKEATRVDDRGEPHQTANLLTKVNLPQLVNYSNTQKQRIQLQMNKSKSFIKTRQGTHCPTDILLTWFGSIPITIRVRKFMRMTRQWQFFVHVEDVSNLVFRTIFRRRGVR
jgi:hypothetical protein